MVKIEIMKKNPALEPIARLAEITAAAHDLAKQAGKIGDELSLLACKAEICIDSLPPVEGWMRLCDYYKNAARQFADALLDAVHKARIDELDSMMQQYKKSVALSLQEMYRNNPDFRRGINEAIRRHRSKGTETEQ